jgi:hypothetical protein
VTGGILFSFHYWLCVLALVNVFVCLTLSKGMFLLYHYMCSIRHQILTCYRAHNHFNIVKNRNLIIPSILHIEYVSLHDIYDGEIPFQTGQNIAFVVSILERQHEDTAGCIALLRQEYHNPKFGIFELLV